MTMWSLTKERKDELMRQRDEKLKELQNIQAKSPKTLWREDLDNLLAELNKVGKVWSFEGFYQYCKYSLFIKIATCEFLLNFYNKLLIKNQGIK